MQVENIVTHPPTPGPKGGEGQFCPHLELWSLESIGDSRALSHACAAAIGQPLSSWGCIQADSRLTTNTTILRADGVDI